MALVTLQLLEGLERGHVYIELPTPITIGREDDNAVRLNDERVSRFHAKIQEDGGRIILTDLDSTNGTRVNGHPVQMRVLHVGDQLAIGRCILVFGSRQDIVERARELAGERSHRSRSGDQTLPDADSDSGSHDSLEESPSSSDLRAAQAIAEPPEDLFPTGPPEPPEGLRPLQKAQVSDFLAYIHEQLRHIIQTAYEEPSNKGRGMEVMRLAWAEWQRILKLEMDLAIHMRRLADPEV
ncbi:MAG: FHA domain-containing protein [Planctomycetes bacterium]|nr:FHA domain-containing protein [Planctomycetota bacterium]